MNGFHASNGHVAPKTHEWEMYATKGMAAYRAPSLLQPHRARKAIADAHAGRIPPLMGMFCAIGSPEVNEIVAQLGFDFVWVEWEHASMSVERMTQMVHDIQFFSEGKTAALVRVPGHSHEAIGYALDAGASIVLPQVDTLEQAKHIVSASKFGARVGGKRSAPPGRWLADAMTRCDSSMSFWENQNAQAAVIIQTESLEGIRNLDTILTEVGEHIDSVWLGSLDLRVSMGLPGFWGEEPEWLDAIQVFRATLRKHNMPYSGMATGDASWLKQRGDGRSLMFTCSDVDVIMRISEELNTARSLFPGKDLSTPKADWEDSDGCVSKQVSTP